MNEIVVVLVGQPNVGKSALINKISGSNLRVGNFSGVTIEKAEAHINYKDFHIKIIDLPGIYSLNEYSSEEQVSTKYLQNEHYDVILNVADSTNLERNLFLSAQIMALNKKMIIALNMADEAQNEGIKIDYQHLSNMLGVNAMLVSAKSGKNLSALLDCIIDVHKKPFCAPKRIYGEFIEHEIELLSEFIIERKMSPNPRELAIKILTQDALTYGVLRNSPFWVELAPFLESCIKRLYAASGEQSLKAIFLNDDYAYARGAANEVCSQILNSKTITEKIDKILLNRYLGIPIFLFFMWMLFNLTFSIGAYPQGWIEDIFGVIGDFSAQHIQNPFLSSLIGAGIIGGVGAVISFLPLILILFLGIILLESTGYMARVSFLLDGFFHRFGLHGKSFIPLVSGFGCSIPAYMSTRILKSQKDKLITMFIIGFMSCSARLPIYVLFVGAFFSEDVAGNVLFGIYILGASIGLIMAKILKMSAFKGIDEPFVMEMPKYRIPSINLVLRSVWNKTYYYLRKAGTFIFLASILIWFSSQYPKPSEILEKYESVAMSDELNNQMQSELLEASYIGQFGTFVSPIFAPLGFDWKLTVALVSGIAAKEVVVSTLGVLYSLGDEETQALREIIKSEIPLPSAVAFVLFVMFYLPCFSASIVFIKEAGKNIYGFYLFLLTSAVAYFMALLGYYITALIIK